MIILFSSLESDLQSYTKQTVYFSLYTLAHQMEAAELIFISLYFG